MLLSVYRRPFLEKTRANLWSEELMSKQHVLDFILRVNADTDLQSRVRVAAMEGLSGLIKVADEVGYRFTAAEFHTASIRRPKPAPPPDELSDNELKAVVGGVDHFNAGSKTPFDEILDIIAGGGNSANTQSSPSIEFETYKLKRLIDK
jgi:predicted ribosomally synthesized peptide with nif11-like leader